MLGPAGRPWTITVRAGGALVSGRLHDSDLERLVDRDAQSAVSERHVEHRRADARDRRRNALLQQGDVTFRFANSWNYTVGNYTQTVTFTLTSP